MRKVLISVIFTLHHLRRNIHVWVLRFMVVYQIKLALMGTKSDPLAVMISSNLRAG